VPLAAIKTIPLDTHSEYSSGVGRESECYGQDPILKIVSTVESRGTSSATHIKLSLVDSGKFNQYKLNDQMSILAMLSLSPNVDSSSIKQSQNSVAQIRILCIALLRSCGIPGSSESRCRFIGNRITKRNMQDVSNRSLRQSQKIVSKTAEVGAVANTFALSLATIVVVLTCTVMITK